MNTTYLAVIYYNLLENKGYDKEIYKHRESARVRLTNDKKINFEVLQQAFETLQTEQQEEFNNFVANKKAPQ